MDLWLPPKPAIIIPKPEIRKPVSFAPAYLPGLIPTGPTATDTTITLHATGQNSGAAPGQSTTTLPGTVASGDLIIFFDRYNAAAATPAGYTNIVSINQTVREMVSWKLSTGSDGGATINGMNAGAGGNWRNYYYVWRRSPTATSVTFSTPNAQATTGDPTTQTVVASGGTPPLVVMASYSADNAFTANVFSPAEDATADQAGAQFQIRYKIYNTGPQDTTVDQADNGTLFNHLVSFYVSMS